MDPPRSSHNNPHRGHAPAPPYPQRSSARDVSSSVSPQPTTSLPPIHTLHPDLHHPASLQSHAHPVTMGPSHTHMSTSGYLASTPGSGSVLGTRPAPDDSDPEGDLPGPPKKKRRRQALSCTECKRRKIKCDRAQPCGPCARRGEQQKCQWHIIEPMEKYVTRAEYDELKGRFEELESLVFRYIPGMHSGVPALSTGTVSGIPMTAGPPSEPVQGTAITPYHQTATTSNLAVYHHMMSSPRSPIRGEPLPPSVNRGSATPRSPHSYRPSTSHSGSSIRALPPPIPAHPVSPRPHSPSASMSSSSRLPPPQPSSRRSSLSLAAITTPYTPDTMPRNQSKNQEAQTLPWLGQRLRPALALSGPVQARSCLHLPPILMDLPSAAAQ